MLAVLMASTARMSSRHMGHCGVSSSSGSREAQVRWQGNSDTGDQGAVTAHKSQLDLIVSADCTSLTGVSANV